MKAKRRQELRTNELAQMLAELREFYQKYGAYVWGVVLVVAVVLVGGTFWHRSSVGRAEEAWNRFQAAAQTLQESVRGGDALGEAAQGAMSRLRDLAANAPDNRLRTRARLTLGEVYWLWAMDPRASPAESTRYMDEATKTYEQIVRQGTDPLAGTVATLCMAAIAENGRRFEQARELYRKVANDPAAKQTGVEILASQALERLETAPEVGTFPPRPVVETQPATAPAAAEAAERGTPGGPPITISAVEPTTTAPADESQD